MKQKILLAVGVVVVCGLAARAEQPQSDSKKPPYERLLQGADANRAGELNESIENAEQADEYDKVIELSEELLALRTKVQGADHWKTVSERWELDGRRKIAASPADVRAGWRKALQGNIEAAQMIAKGQSAKAAPLRQEYHRWCLQVYGEKHPHTAASYSNLGANLNAQGKYAEAQPLFLTAAGIYIELLGEKHPDTANSLNSVAFNLNSQGKFAEAQQLYQKALGLYIELRGENHVDTARCCNNLALNLTAQAKYADAQPILKNALNVNIALLGEKHADTATSYNNLAYNLYLQGKYAEAQPLYEKALGLFRELLGEKHPVTATSYNNLAFSLSAQAKYADAEQVLRKALALYIELLGEKHPDTARSYNNLATNLNSQGKYAEAHPLCQKSLELFRLLLGEKHPDTAMCYNNLAFNLNAQAKYADAQPFYHQALALRLEMLGEKHPNTAASYSSLAYNLNSQGKYADALPLIQKALALHLELLGERHPDTARSYNDLAEILNSQGKYGDAQPLIQKALDLHVALFGEKHPITATSYNNLASNLNAQEKYAEALPLFKKALTQYVELLGEKHPDTARAYNNLAENLYAQGQYADALPIFLKANDLYVELLGERHPHTARCCNNLALNLNALGKYADALAYYQKALDIRRVLLGEDHPETAISYIHLAYFLIGQWKYADAGAFFDRAAASYETARLNIGGRGLERAIFGAERSPYRLRAATQAHLHFPAAAWVAAETDLARGLSDEIASRRGATLTPDEQSERSVVSSRLNQLQPRVLQLVSNQSLTDSEQDELAALQAERTTLEAKLAELAATLSRREVAPLAELQHVLATDAALILWVDATDASGGVNEHWGCVVRQTGEPLWERLSGTGAAGKWTDDDSALPEQLRNALAAVHTSQSKLDVLTTRVHAQRLAPLVRHLAGIKTLYVAGVNQMAGIPIEVLTRDVTISYVPSGTFLAHLSQRNPPGHRGLLALGDPQFSRTDAAAKQNSHSEPPAGGVLITTVVPESAAAQAQLLPGDVLIRYGDAELNSVDQLLAAIQSRAGDKEVLITVWRDGEPQPFTRNVASGRLGVVLNREPARESIVNRRKADAMLASLHRGDWKELPGTRVEVTQLAKLFGEQSTTLVDSAASEQELDDLRKKGDLSQFRYLHLATHGHANDVKAFESVLILAQDSLPKDPLPRVGEPVINGQLSASEVLEYWDLNADLVTLSACETALGRKGGGDGLLGFAQAFLTKGSRAVCLSLWKVDDTATALLMTRFYQNLLGKRPGLKQPMGKALALAEAKKWLRELSSDEALKLSAAATNGVVRGSRGKDEDLKLAIPSADSKQPTTAAAISAKPFAHPRFWSAFILIGDPN